MHIQYVGGQRKCRSVKNGMGGRLNLFKSFRRDMDTLALWTITLTLISHFKLEEIVAWSNSKEDTEISGGIGLRKRGEVLRKYIVIIIDLEGFTLMSKTAVPSFEQYHRGYSWGCLLSFGGRFQQPLGHPQISFYREIPWQDYLS